MDLDKVQAARERFEEKYMEYQWFQCWPFIESRNDDGYGEFWIDGRMVKAHRVAYALEHEEVPGDEFVLHSCHIPNCVNPNHLRLGTHSENVRDAVERGTWREARTGEDNGRAELSAEQVRAIRDRYDATDATYSDLADEYGVTSAHIGRIVREERWADA
jgi:hypothetical protein